MDRIIKISDYDLETPNSIERIKKDSILVVATSWHCSLKAVDAVKKIKCDNVIILANTEYKKNFFEKKCPNVDVVFCNNNALINEDNFKILYDVTKKYDLVINSRFSAYKNVGIANLCENTIHIGYFNTGENYKFPRFGKYANFKKPTDYGSLKRKNYSIFNKEKITQYLNESYVGGIFSTIEGQCRGSSEYLLCGIPVVSTKSLGGRDIWYNNDNSIICEFNPQSVSDAVNLAKQLVINGTFNAEKIRNQHLLQSYEHRERLIDVINGKLDDSEKVEYVNVKAQLLHN